MSAQRKPVRNQVPLLRAAAADGTRVLPPSNFALAVLDLPLDPTRKDIDVTDDVEDAPDGALIKDEDGWRLRVGDHWRAVLVATDSPEFAAAAALDEARARKLADAAVVTKLPRRVAHAVCALVESQNALNMPVSAAEVCVYDSEALSVRSTAAALTAAQRLGLCVHTGRYWIATGAAMSLRYALEDRFLAESADEQQTLIARSRLRVT